MLLEHLCFNSCRKKYVDILVYLSFQFSYKPAFADWSSEMRDQPMLSSVDLNNWIVVVPERAEQQARDLVQTLSRITPRLGMQLREPLL